MAGSFHGSAPQERAKSRPVLWRDPGTGQAELPQSGGARAHGHDRGTPYKWQMAVANLGMAQAASDSASVGRPRIMSDAFSAIISTVA